MALAKAEWKRRLEAVLTLMGMDLADLKRPVKEKGLPVNAAARAGHESDNYMPNEALAMVVAEILDVPVAWFEAEDWRALIRESPEVAAAEAPVTMQTFLQAKTEVLLAVDEARRELGGRRKNGLSDESTEAES